MANPKSPTKAELLQLQKLYKTDEKIGERLGGVPAYLVAYWRRKKNIPKYSLPKFSEQEVRNLWERFGDDEKAGLELGLSKAAFYNWRRRYGFREKPAFLKLEQLEFNFPGARPGVHGVTLYGKRTVARKVIARLLDRESVKVGESVTLEPDLALVPGNADDVIEKFRASGNEFVWNPGKIVLSSGAGIGETSGRGGRSLTAREFARRQGIKSYYDDREGTRFQVVIERGHVLPGTLTMVSDHFATSLGSLGALSLGIDAATMSRLWRSGNCTITVPASVQLLVGGRRSRGVMAADIALSIVQQMRDKEIADKILECGGSAISQMSIAERSALVSMGTLLGAAELLCPYDATTRRYLVGRTDSRYAPVIADKDAEYDSVYQFNIDSLTPLVAGPDDFHIVRPAAEMDGVAVNQVIIGSCYGGRFDELRIAADILKGNRVHADCRLLVIPGSRSTYLEALKKGLIRVFTEAGAIVLPPAFCPCDSIDSLFPGERCLSTSPPHLPRAAAGKTAEWFLGSPATAAAASLEAAFSGAGRHLG